MAEGLDKALREMLLPKPSDVAEVAEDAEDEAAAELSEA